MSARVAGHGYITATLEEPRELVAQYRRNALAVHKLSERTPGRNAGATRRAWLARLAEQEAAELAAAIVGGQERLLLSALRDERQTWERLQHAVMRGQVRDELVERLEGDRRVIRRMVAVLEEAGR